MQMTSWVQRTKAMAVVLGTMLGVTVAQATLHSPETNPATDYRDGYTANVVPKSSSVLLYANAQLSKVVGVKGDFFFLHTNFSLPYFAECEWSIIDGVETNDGLFHYHYENTGTEEYALCQFQSRFRGSYLFVVTLKLTQVGNAIYAQVVGATYPWNEKYGDDHEATTFGVTYFENLDEIAGSSGGMTRASLSNVSLIFADGGATCNVTFEDLDGNVLSTQEVGYGEAATPPTNVPAVEGYVLAGWDGNISAIQKDTVFKPVYHKLCTVTFQDPDGAQIGDAQLVEETKGATPPDMTGRSYDGAPFYKWNGDASVISADTTFTAIYKRIPVWTTGSYVPADWTPAAKNIMPNATVSNNGLT